MREVLERAGLKKDGECNHQFRHTYAKIFLELGGTLHHLSDSLGHRRVSTTEKYYKHFSSEDTAKAASREVNRRSRRRSPRR